MSATLDMVPDRTTQQRREALARGNEIRTKRAQLKISIKVGSTSAIPIIQDPPDYVETMKVVDLLLAVPKYGRVKANKMLNRVHISPSKTVGGMSDRQRRELIALLRT